LRDKIDFTEGFIDASFTAAKKEALSSVLQSAAKATTSWQSSTDAVFLSPWTWLVLHHMKFGSNRDCKNFEATSLARPTADELFSVCDSGARRRRGDRSPGR
jgi:hypothetical protein